MVRPAPRRPLFSGRKPPRIDGPVQCRPPCRVRRNGRSLLGSERFERRPGLLLRRLPLYRSRGATGGRPPGAVALAPTLHLTPGTSENAVSSASLAVLRRFDSPI